MEEVTTYKIPCGCAFDVQDEKIQFSRSCAEHAGETDDDRIMPLLTAINESLPLPAEELNRRLAHAVEESLLTEEGP